ncbi:MAG: lactate/malate family dehydrogenase [Actinomycetes bacterium]
MTTRPTTRPWPRHAVVLGAAGLVGSGVAEQLVVTATCESVELVDPRRNVARSHVVDLAEAQVLAGDATTTVTEVAADDARPADLVVVAASLPETPDGDRRDFLAGNLALLQALAPTVSRLAGSDGVVLVLSNPVDVLTEALRRLNGLDPTRLLGYSLNDSVRFRAALGRELGVHPGRVGGVVLGEHGAGQVPLFSRVTLDDQPVTLDPEAQRRVRADVDGWFERWSRLRPGRSSGWTTPVGTRRMVEAMATGEVLPACVWTGGHPDLDDLDDCYLTLPARLGPSGLAGTELWALTPQETDGLRRAAASVAAAADEALDQARRSA